jgi:endoglucanase
MPTACLALALVAVSNIASARDRAERGRAADPWAHWEAFREHFISEDGRVIDRTADGRSTSEGQAYALFFALVADDRALFDTLLTWTEDNLAAGDLTRTLPGWLWGQDEEGTWRLLDANSAADADLWLVYTLLEAGRLWGEPRYFELAGILAARIVETEVVDVPTLGPMLLPGPSGFVLDESTWRFNPSYLPLPVLRRLHAAYPEGPWGAIADTTVTLLCSSNAHGCAPDWIGYQEGVGFIADPVTGAVGSYDAIRTYLWTGALPRREKHRGVLEDCLDGMLQHYRTTDQVPEMLEGGLPVADGTAGPPGFYGAVLTMASGRRNRDAAQALRAHLEATRTDELYGSPPAYYDQCLLLFALGNVDGRYRFRANGRLEPGWGRRCTSP